MRSYLIILLLALTTSVFAQKVKTPVEIHGALQVDGAQILSANHGEPVQLRGMSLFWSQWADGNRFYNEGVVETLVNDWKINVLRIAMGVGNANSGYLRYPTVEKNRVIEMVDAALSHGIYAIIDWHSHDAHNEEEEAKIFFAEMAQLYGDNPNVIYELYNEPLEVSWSGTIKPYCEAVIDTIRVHDPDNLIICGTRTWSQEVLEVADDMIQDNNVAYTLHYYAASHDNWLRNRAQNAVDAGVPLFVTEYGTTEASGNGVVDEVESNIWWDFLDDNHISWCNWSVSNKDESASILKPGSLNNGDWTLDDYTESGAMVRNELRTHYELPVYENDLTLVADFDEPLIFKDSSFAFDLSLMALDTLIHDSLVTYTLEASNGGSFNDKTFVPNGDLGNFKLFVTAQYDTLFTTSTYNFTVTDIAPGEISDPDSLKLLALYKNGEYMHDVNFNVLSSLLDAVPLEGNTVETYSWGPVDNVNGVFAQGNSAIKSVFGLYIISPIEQQVKLKYNIQGSVNDLLNGSAIGSEIVTLNSGANLYIAEYTSYSDTSAFSFSITTLNDEEVPFLSYSLLTDASYDCAGDWGGSAKLTEECGCVGGSTGIPECPGPFGDNPISIPGIIESEEYDRGGQNVGYFDDSPGNEGAYNNRAVDDVDKETSGDNDHFDGDGNIGWINEGEWLKYTIDVTQSEKYLIDFRVASAFSWGEIDLRINDRTILKNRISVASTGGWSDWETLRSDTVYLERGVQELYMYATGSGFNITYMQFHLANAVGLSEDLNATVELYPNPFSADITLASDEKIDYSILTLDGVVLQTGECDGLCPIGNGLSRGMYLLKLEHDGRISTQKITKF